VAPSTRWQSHETCKSQQICKQLENENAHQIHRGTTNTKANQETYLTPYEAASHRNLDLSRRSKLITNMDQLRYPQPPTVNHGMLMTFSSHQHSHEPQPRSVDDTDDVDFTKDNAMTPVKTRACQSKTVTSTTVNQL
jgi:hypothetical protein